MERTAKQWARDALKLMPDDISQEELIYQLAFRAHVEEGLRDAAAGRTVPHEEMERKAADWLKSAGLQEQTKT